MKQKLKNFRCWTRGYHQMEIEHISRLEYGIANLRQPEDWYYLRTNCGCGATVPDAREVLFRNDPSSLIETTWSSR